MTRLQIFGIAASALKRPVTLAAFISLATVGPFAQAETLQDALAKAYQNNPTLLAARARLRAVDEGVPEALSGWRPTVSVNYDVGKIHSDSSGGSSSSGGSQNRTPRIGSITLDQNLFQGGRTSSTTKRAEQEVLAERARLATTEQQVMFDGGTAYASLE